MESSTKIPITSDIAKRVIRFMEHPVSHMPIMVVISEAGMATITMVAFRKLCKKSNMTRATSRIENNKSS